MSSSNRQIPACDGILIRGQQPIGPMRLPCQRASDFVAHFNRTYARVGLSIDSRQRDVGQELRQEEVSNESTEAHV
jgi:hypothetical protein